MCGIFAAIRTNGFFTDSEKILLEKSVEMVKYRGPDALKVKYYSSNEYTSKDNVFLGHNRLAIIDLSSDGIQPFTNDNKIHIVFNGEIYNYIELRKELQAKGYTFKTKTDTEVIINLYKAEGVEGFGKMNGMWAFILYDSEKKTVVVSRDRFAVKPLYYILADDTYYFGSEIKQLLPFLKKYNLNLNTFGNYLHNFLADYSNETMFSEVNKVPPKCSFVIDLKSKEIQLKKYWDYQLLDFSNRKQSDLNEEFSYLLNNSVQIRLRSDVKVGNTLSGGLDSSSIAVIANEISPMPIENVSVISKNPKISEEKYVDALIKNNDIKVTKIAFDEIDCWDMVEEVIWHNDEPILSLSTIAHFNMMKLFHEKTDITVILSGQGGDESLGGYNKYFFENLKELNRNGKYAKLAKEAIYILPKFINEFKLTNAQRYLNPSLRNKSFIENSCGLPYTNDFITKSNTFRDRQILDIDKYSVPALNHYEDRTAMASSLEIRLPFLDFRLVNFNLNLPIEYKIKNGFTKSILRENMSQLPKEIAWRKDKKGFDVNENDFVNFKNWKRIETLFTNSKLQQFEIIDEIFVKDEIKNYLLRKNKYWIRDINRLIFSEIWLRKFF